VKTKGVLFPLAALVIGVASAYIAVLYTSAAFCLLPVLAFLFGYFSSYRAGLISAVLLYVGYTATLFPMPDIYFGASDYLYYLGRGLPFFLFFGFLFCMIGYGGQLVRRGVRRSWSVEIVVLLVLLVSWCVFVSWPRHEYYYELVIESREGLGDLEVYLPATEALGEPYDELFDHPAEWLSFVSEGRLTGGYSVELVDTEHGTMVRFTIPELRQLYDPRAAAPADVPPYPDGSPPPAPRANARPAYPYDARLFFQMSTARYEQLRFAPKSEIEERSTMRGERRFGGIRVEASEIVEDFKVPLKVSSDGKASVVVRFEIRSSRSRGIWFIAGERKQEYSETCKAQAVPTNEWALVSGQAVSRTWIPGP